jgi:hypothetical protein
MPTLGLRMMPGGLFRDMLARKFKDGGTRARRGRQDGNKCKRTFFDHVVVISDRKLQSLEANYGNSHQVG